MTLIIIYVIDVINVNFEHISQLFLVFQLWTLNEQMLAGK